MSTPPPASGPARAVGAAVDAVLAVLLGACAFVAVVLVLALVAPGTQAAIEGVAGLGALVLVVCAYVPVQRIRRGRTWGERAAGVRAPRAGARPGAPESDVVWVLTGGGARPSVPPPARRA